jgi:hypothetical protein
VEIACAKLFHREAIRRTEQDAYRSLRDLLERGAHDPVLLRHYEPIVDRIVVFDDGSSDRPLELLAVSPKVEVRRPKQGESSILRRAPPAPGEVQRRL